MISIDALAGIAAIDAANEGGSDSAGLYDPKNPAKAATHEGLYANRKAAMKAAGVTFGTKAYKDWDAKTRAAMGVKKGDKFSSGQWMETFGGMSPSQINAYEGDAEWSGSGAIDSNLLGKGIAKSLSGMKNFYLDDENPLTIQSALTMEEGENKPGVPTGGTMSMSPYEAPSFEEYEARFRQSGGNTIRSFLGQGKQDITGEVIGRLKATPNLSKEFKRALTVGGLPNFVIDDMDANTAAQYDSYTDTVTLGENWSLDDLAHELSHRAVMRNTPGLEKIQMPNVQALYEVGGNALTPGYGSQGELVTSRAGTAQNLVDAMQYGGFSGTHQEGTAGTGGWADAYGTYDFDKQRWDIDYMKAMTQSPTSNPLDHAAIKAGWTATTPLNEMAEGLKQYHTAHPTYSVPGTGNWKGGYENWMALQNEMPTKSYGAAYDSQGKVFGPASQTEKRSGGLWNAPMQGAHALVQEFMIRNSDMLEHGKYNYDVREAMYNKFVAEELQRPRDPYSTRIEHFKHNPAPGTENIPDYAPQAKIGLIEKLGLAKEFWDKVGEYWDRYDQHMGSSQ